MGLRFQNIQADIVLEVLSKSARSGKRRKSKFVSAREREREERKALDIEREKHLTLRSDCSYCRDW